MRRWEDGLFGKGSDVHKRGRRYARPASQSAVQDCKTPDGGLIRVIYAGGCADTFAD